MDLKYPVILGITAALAWWLSRYDSRVTAENPIPDLKRRTLRCGITLLLVTVGLAAGSGGGIVGGFVCIATVVPIGILWTGCLSEVMALGFHQLVDASDSREFDPKELTRELDRLAELVQQGRSGEAIRLCSRLRGSADGSAVALEEMLFRAYDQMFAGGASMSPPLAEAQRLYEQGHCLLAASRLDQILKTDSGNLTAVMMLMRLHARNLRNPDRAFALLQEFEHGQAVPPGFVEYACHRIRGWADPASERKKSVDGIESVLVERKYVEPPEEEFDPERASVSELLKTGHLGSAIEILERSVKERPQDFDLRLQLAEAYGKYCCNLKHAQEIVAKIEADPTFSRQRVEEAKAKLKAWQARQPNR